MVVLSEYQSVVLLAYMAFGEARIIKPVSKLDLMPRLKIIQGKVKRIGEPRYKDYFECRNAYYKCRQIEKEWISNYLKENYPNKDYYKTYLEQNLEYDLPLRFPTEESVKCNYHTDDKHCNIERESGCYTCCFVCWSSKVCKWCNCELLKII